MFVCTASVQDGHLGLGTACLKSGLNTPYGENEGDMEGTEHRGNSSVRASVGSLCLWPER